MLNKNHVYEKLLSFFKDSYFGINFQNKNVVS